jgi:hypothetical protein
MVILGFINGLPNSTVKKSNGEVKKAAQASSTGTLAEGTTGNG